MNSSVISFLRLAPKRKDLLLICEIQQRLYMYTQQVCMTENTRFAYTLPPQVALWAAPAENASVEH